MNTLMLTFLTINFTASSSEFELDRELHGTTENRKLDYRLIHLLLLHLHMCTRFPMNSRTRSQPSQRSFSS